MLRVKTILTLIAVLITLPTIAVFGAEKRLTIGATSTASPFYGYFIAVSKLINVNIKDVFATVIETGATVDNLKRMKRGQLDLGLVTTNTLNHAYFGSGKFQNEPIKSKLLWVYFVTPQTTLVRKDSNVKDFQELNGKKFSPGLRGSATEETTMDVFKVLEVKPEYFKGSVSDYTDGFKDNLIVGYVGSSMGDKFSSNQIDVATFTPINVLSLTADQASKIKEKLPELSIYDVPEGAGKGIPAFKTWAFALATSAAEGLDTATAYQIVKMVMEDKEVQVGSMPSIKGVDIAKLTLQMANSPLHPGAIKYFREKGYKIPEHLIAAEDR